MHYYQHNIGDYRRDTSHLSLLEHGVYRTLLDLYYLNETPIPKETDWVIRRLSAKTNEEILAIQAVLKDFFVEGSDGYKHKRCDMEIREYTAKADTARHNGKLGGRPKKTQSVILVNQEVTELKANHEPLTNNHKPVTKERERSAAKRRQQIPDAFYPDETGLDKAREKGLSVAVQLTKFVDYHVGKGSVMSDWQAAWRTWVGNARPETPSSQLAETAYQRSKRELYERAIGRNKKPIVEIFDEPLELQNEFASSVD